MRGNSMHALRVLVAVGFAVAFPAGTSVAQAPFEPASDGVPRVLETLASKITDLEIVDATLLEAVERIRRASGANLVVDPELAEWMEEEGRRFTLRLKKVSLLDALDILLEFAAHSVRCEREGTLFLTSAENAEVPAVQVLYDLSKILRPARYEPSYVRDLIRTYQEEEARAFGGGVEEDRIYAEDMACMIRDSVEPESWDGGRYQLQVIGNFLAVAHTPEVHRRVREVLRDLEAMRGPSILVRARPYLVRASALAGLAPGRTLSEKDLARIESAASACPQPFCEIRLPVMNGERTHMKTGKEFIFTTGRDRGDRYYDKARDGVVLDAQPLFTGSDRVPLVLRLFLSRAEEEEGGCPRLLFHRIETALVVPAGKPVLAFAGSAPFPGSAPGSLLAVVIRVEPGSWSRTSLRTRLSAKDARAWNLLRKTRISVDFMDTPIEKAMANIAEQSGLNIVIHPDVYDEFSKDELMVILKVGDIPLDQVLSLVCNLKNLGMKVKRGVLHIQTEPGDLGPRTELRTFPVHDLVCPYRIPEWTLGPRTPLIRPPWVELDFMPDEAISMEALVNMIRESVHPDSWDTPPNEIQISMRRILARNRPKILDGIDRVLARLRARMWSPVSVEGTFFRAKPGWLEARKIQGPGLTAKACGRLEEALGEGGAEAVATFRGSGTMVEPLVLTGGIQVVHVQDWSGPDRYDTDVLLDGWHFEGMALPSPAGKGLVLSFSAFHSRYLKPAKPAREPGEVELLRFGTEIRLLRGGGCVLGASGSGAEPALYLYLRVR